MQQPEPKGCSGQPCRLRSYSVRCRSLGSKHMAWSAAARAVVSPYHLAPKCSSLIEREFLLWCLAMMFENICQKAKMRIKKLGQRFIAKKCYGHQTSFRIEIAGIKRGSLGRRSSSRADFRSGVLFRHASGENQHESCY